jgi:hypothetical protein
MADVWFIPREGTPFKMEDEHRPVIIVRHAIKSTSHSTVDIEYERLEFVISNGERLAHYFPRVADPAIGPPFFQRGSGTSAQARLSRFISAFTDLLPEQAAVFGSILSPWKLWDVSKVSADIDANGGPAASYRQPPFEF